MTKPTDSPAAKLPMPRGFKLFIALAVLMVVGAAISLFDKSEFYADVFIEISVFCVFLAGFFTNTRTLQFAYLVGANIYVIVCLGAFSTVFFTKMNQGVGVLLIIQIIFSCLNLVPIIIYHLTDREFFYTYQRQLIYPTLFFVFVLLGHLPGGDVLARDLLPDHLRAGIRDHGRDSQGGQGAPYGRLCDQYTAARHEAGSRYR